MGYCIEPGEPIGPAIKRIANEQIERAMVEVNNAAEDRNHAIHQVRKRCKKLRGLLRLVRPGIDFYKGENRAFRDAARPLSEARDWEAMAETYDMVMDHYEDEVERSDFAHIRRALTIEKQNIVNTDEMGERLCAFHAKMVDAQQRVEDWSLEKSPGKSIQKGVAKTYGRATNAMAAAYDDPTPDRFHQWRKRAKYHWYHARLLEELWPAMVKPYRREVKQVSSALGDHHDLAILAGKLNYEPELFGGGHDVEQLAKLADDMRANIEHELRCRGRRLFAFKPKQVGKLARRTFEGNVHDLVVA